MYLSMFSLTSSNRFLLLFILILKVFESFSFLEKQPGLLKWTKFSLKHIFNWYSNLTIWLNSSIDKQEIFLKICYLAVNNFNSTTKIALWNNLFETLFILIILLICVTQWLNSINMCTSTTTTTVIISF